MRRLSVFGLVLFSCCVSARADLVLGNLRISGAEFFFNRGWGRSLYYDLTSANGRFQVITRVGDGVHQRPGTILDGTAVPGPRVLLHSSDSLAELVLGGVSQWVRPSGTAIIQSVPVALPVLPPPPQQSTTFFTLDPTPFTLTGHLTVRDPGFRQILLDTDISGSGLAYMKGGLVDIGEPQPMYYIWDTELVFSDVPEPSVGLLLVLAIGLYALWRLRRWRSAARALTLPRR